MTAALVTGAIFKAPESRTSKSGKPFVTATIRAKDGEGFQFVRLVAFSETVQAELLRLHEGESLTIQGSLKAELYRPEGGEPKLSLSMVADHVLALRQPPKARTPKSTETSQDTRSRHERCTGQWEPGGGPSDDIPFGGGQL
jgi:single-stranded DNA-binding protein